MIKQFEAMIQRAVGAAGEEPRKHSDGRTIYRAVATTPALDRYGEVVLPKGAIVDHFMKNPVLLENHNYAASSVGHVLNLGIEEHQVTFDFVFSTDQRGVELEQKFVMGDMNAFSIGFKPKAKMDLWAPWDDAPEIKEVKVAYPDGSEGVVDLTGYEQVPYRIYNKWELLEISPVAVPANPEALLLRQAEEIIRRTVEHNPAMKSFVQDQLAEVLAPAMAILESFNAKFEDGEVKFEGAVASHSTPIEEGAWSGSAARAALAKWASKGGSGKKEDMNWAKYSKGFAWFDSKDADSLGAYKLPHHTVKDGTLVAVWRGVTSAMAALLGARGGTDLDSKEAVYRHLAKHYKDFEKEPPEMKDYSEEELKAIEEEVLVVRSEGEGVTPPEPVEKADPPAEGEEPAPANMPVPQALAKVLAMLAKISAAIDKMSAQEDDTAETQEEHFMELLMRTESIADQLEYSIGKGNKKEVKPAVQKEVVGEVSADLVAQLERLAL